jgi:hypothetical protein
MSAPAAQVDAKTGSGKPSALVPWWGRFDVEPGTSLHFRIGPRELWLERMPRELRVTTLQHDDPLDATLVVADRAEAPEPGGTVTAERYALPEGSPGIVLEPALADRPVVVRTHEPFRVLAEDEVTLYLSTPAWIRISSTSGGKQLTELPCHRPSNTWFGPNTREGELCYAGVTAARLSLDELAMRPGRVVTRVSIVNQSESRLDLDRIALPVPALSVYAAPDRRLWTEPVRVLRERDGSIAGVTIEEEQAPEAGETVLLSGPRRPQDQSVLARAFRALLGE